jgi:hypothetical protein
MLQVNVMKFSEYQHIVVNDLLGVFGTVITYKRRNEVIAEDIPAIPSNTDMPIDKTEAKTRVKTTRLNFLVEALLLSVEPQAGDRIINGDKTYEVVNSDNKQCYRPIDPENKYLKIYVQKIK